MLLLSATIGKSLYIKRLYEKLKHSDKSSVMKCIRLINPNIDEDVVLQSLLTTPTRTTPVLFHFDISSSVSLLQLMKVFVPYEDVMMLCYEDVLPP